jgi:hypothetical protein
MPTPFFRSTIIIAAVATGLAVTCWDAQAGRHRPAGNSWLWAVAAGAPCHGSPNIQLPQSGTIAMDICYVEEGQYPDAGNVGRFGARMGWPTPLQGSIDVTGIMAHPLPSGCRNFTASSQGTREIVVSVANCTQPIPPTPLKVATFILGASGGVNLGIPHELSFYSRFASKMNGQLAKRPRSGRSFVEVTP